MSRLSHAARAVRAIRAAILRPPYATPGHFYSPLTSTEDIRRAQLWKPEAPGVDLNGDAQLALAHKLAGTVGEPPPGPRWFHRLVSCRQGGVGCVLAAVTRAAAPEAGCCGAPA